MIPADDCTTMAEVRVAIDELDRQLVTLLAQRLRYIEAAARIKTDRNVVRDEWRKADVLNKVTEAARESDLPVELVQQLWENLIEFSISHEFKRFDSLQAAQQAS